MSPLASSVTGGTYVLSTLRTTDDSGCCVDGMTHRIPYNATAAQVQIGSMNRRWRSWQRGRHGAGPDNGAGDYVITFQGNRRARRSILKSDRNQPDTDECARRP